MIPAAQMLEPMKQLDRRRLMSTKLGVQALFCLQRYSLYLCWAFAPLGPLRNERQ